MCTHATQQKDRNMKRLNSIKRTGHDRMHFNVPVQVKQTVIDLSYVHDCHMTFLIEKLIANFDGLSKEKQSQLLYGNE